MSASFWRLVPLDSPDESDIIIPLERVIIIGRSPSCTVVCKDSAISAEQCEICFRKDLGVPQIKNVGRNATLVKRVKETLDGPKLHRKRKLRNEDDEMQLENLDVLFFPGTTFRFQVKREMARKFPIIVHGLAGDICQLEASTGWAVSDVKHVIKKASSIPVIEQRLFVGGTELQQKCTMIELTQSLGLGLTDFDASTSQNIKEVVDLTLVRRPRDQAWWLARVEGDGLLLRLAPSHIQADRDVVQAAVIQCVSAFQFASSSLREDEQFILRLLHDCAGTSGIFRYAPDKLTRDRVFAVEAVRHRARIFNFLDQDLTQCREFVLAAVKANISVRHFISEASKIDDEIMAIVSSSKSSKLYQAAEEARTSTLEPAMKRRKMF